MWRAGVTKCQVKCCQLVIDTQPCLLTCTICRWRQHWLCVSCEFSQAVGCSYRERPTHFFLNRALLRLNPALRRTLSGAPAYRKSGTVSPCQGLIHDLGFVAGSADEIPQQGWGTKSQKEGWGTLGDFVSHAEAGDLLLIRPIYYNDVL